MDLEQANIPAAREAFIEKKLLDSKIAIAQIDPFSYCNSRCWYCPIRYVPQPRQAIKHMPVELFRKIIADIDQEKKKEAGVVSKHFNFIYTAHYNEVLLYKHFREMLDILREFNIKTSILSNGIALTPQKTDLLKQYPDVVTGICLNIPAFEPETWAKRSGNSLDLFPCILENLHYAADQLLHLTAAKKLSIQVNGINANSLFECGGWLEKGASFPNDLDLDPEGGELQKQYYLAKSLFPGLHIYTLPNLIDRAGILGQTGVMSNKKAIAAKLKKEMKYVTGCRSGIEGGDRIFGWLHVNSLGQTFLCCNDYHFGYVFGDFRTQTLKDFWCSDSHKRIITNAFHEVCTNCASSEWGNNF